MALNISREHPTFQLKAKVQAFCSRYLQTHGFSYFQFLRCYPDGSFDLLTNNTGLFEYICQIDEMPVIYSSFTNAHESQPAYWFFWDDELPAFPVNLARSHFKIYHGVTLMRRNKDCYDMIAFGLPKPQQNVAAFYLTKYKIMEKCIFLFEKMHSDLIRDVKTATIALPEALRDSNYQKICLEKKALQIITANGNVPITPQEFHCLQLLNMGAQQKEVANIMAISPRTVETYLSRIKDRTGLTNYMDLAQSIVVCP